jgi:hypothetical protein
VREAPLIVVLGTARDDRAAWLDAGQALQRLLLLATRNGVGVGLLNQTCQVPEVRSALQDVLGDPSHPQAVLRMGYVDERNEPIRETNGSTCSTAGSCRGDAGNEATQPPAVPNGGAAHDREP